MPRAIVPSFDSELRTVSTTPAFIIDITHDGTTLEKFITNSAVSRSGYGPGAKILSLTDSTAEIELVTTADRIGEVIDGDWRQGACEIAAVDDDASINNDVVIFSGTIDTSRYSGGRIIVSVVSESIQGKYAPVYTYDGLCPYMPADGEVMDWDGEPVVATAAPEITARQRWINTVRNEWIRNTYPAHTYTEVDGVITINR